MQWIPPKTQGYGEMCAVFGMINYAGEHFVGLIEGLALMRQGGRGYPRNPCPNLCPFSGDGDNSVEEGAIILRQTFEICILVVVKLKEVLHFPFVFHILLIVTCGRQTFEMISVLSLENEIKRIVYSVHICSLHTC